MLFQFKINVKMYNKLCIKCHNSCKEKHKLVTGAYGPQRSRSIDVTIDSNNTKTPNTPNTLTPISLGRQHG